MAVIIQLDGPFRFTAVAASVVCRHYVAQGEMPEVLRCEVLCRFSKRVKGAWSQESGQVELDPSCTNTYVRAMADQQGFPAAALGHRGFVTTVPLPWPAHGLVREE